jgi:hypothetical protein
MSENPLKILEDKLKEINARTGACLFEIGTPDSDGDWEIAGWGKKGRVTRYGKTLLEAVEQLEQDIEDP